MGANVVNYFPDSLEELRVIQEWFAYPNAVAAKLPAIAYQTRSVSESPHWHWTIVGRHSAELSLSHECSPGTEIARPHSGNNAGWATPDNKYVQHIQNLIEPENWIECPWKVERFANSWKYLNPTLIFAERVRFEPTPIAFTL